MAESVTAEIPYTIDTGEKLVNETFGPNNIRRRKTGTHELKPMTVGNGRLIAGQLFLEEQGFLFVEHKTKVADFFDAGQLKTVYYPEVEQLIKNASGASRVAIFDHTLRSGDEAEREEKLIREPVLSAHNDYTEWSGPNRVREGLAGDRLLQGGVEKRGAYSLFPRGDTEEVANRGGAKDAQRQRLDLRMHFDSRQRNFPRGNCVMIIIANRQTCCVLRLRIDPQQDLVRELIAGGCSGLPKGNVEDISIGIVGNARCFHRFSPPVPKDLVSGHDKIVLGASRNKAATDNGDDRIVAGGQIFKVSVKVSGQKRSQVIAIG